MSVPDRIQGTDGIRGPVQKASAVCELDPLQAFLQQGVLTDQFFELYTYCFGCLLQESRQALPGDEVLLGWDTRDREGHFNQAAINGLRKAGLNTVVLGVQPTPAVAIYLVERKASAALVLTASHNPAHQNGIKIFLGGYALKLFPEDDRRLTQKLRDTPWSTVQQAEPSGALLFAEQEASASFGRFCWDPQNSWLDSFPEHLFVVVDAANGAYGPMLNTWLAPLPQVRVCNDSLEGINQHCGVADLEGVSVILPEEVQAGRFQGYPALQALLEEGQQRPDQQVIGLTFDGDGDRCFLLGYDALRQRIHVCTGDACALLVSRHLRPGSEFVNTVESDLEATRKAVDQGLRTYQCAVGDKWILWRALKSEWEQRATTHPSREKDTLLESLHEMEEHSCHDALRLTQLLQEAEDLQPLSALKFGLGYEESGHLITPGRLADSAGHEKIVYVGNGLKTGLNLLSCLGALSLDSVREFLCSPYSAGFQRSRPVYYVNPQGLLPGNPTRAHLERRMRELLTEAWPEASVKPMFRPEEPLMLAMEVWADESLEALVFIRNSGTEDKATLYLRGRIVDAERLSQVGDQLLEALIEHLKDESKPHSRAELEVLRSIRAGGAPETREHVSLSHLIHEMHLRQGLIERSGPEWELTSWGVLRLEFSERSE